MALSPILCHQRLAREHIIAAMADVSNADAMAHLEAALAGVTLSIGALASRRDQELRRGVPQGFHVPVLALPPRPFPDAREGG